jgi:hypothetical protein
MNENQQETLALEADLEIEVLVGREELLVASAGTCCSGHRGPQVQIVALTD